MDQAKHGWKAMAKGHDWRDFANEHSWKAMAKVNHSQAPPVITAVIFSWQRVIMEHAADKGGHQYLRFPRFNINLDQIHSNTGQLHGDGIKFFEYKQIPTEDGYLFVIGVDNDLRLEYVKEYLKSAGEPFRIGDVRERLKEWGKIGISARKIIQEHGLF
jgi:hypothetical protein